MLIKRGDAEIVNVIKDVNVEDDKAREILDEAKADVKSAQDKLESLIAVAEEDAADEETPAVIPLPESSEK